MKNLSVRFVLFLRIFIFFTFWASFLFCQEFVQVKPKKGDGIYSLLRRYQLPANNQYVQKFKEINKINLNSRAELKIGQVYNMPVSRFVFNGKTIRSTLGYNDYQHAKEIEKYNKAVCRAGIKRKLYTEDFDLWVPMLSLPKNYSPKEENDFPIFGKKYKKITLTDNSLKGKVYYLVSGHGGPDPGAIGKRGAYKMYEDEYAYDITLRLAKNLLEHGARVYMIVQDPNDGIREDTILRGDSDEYYYGGAKISAETIPRLDKRAEIVNNLYNQNRSSTNRHTVIILHVDSRSNSKRIDIFYYYENGSRESKELANILYKTVNQKYSKHQPGRGYGGKVLTRDLHMLRKTEPTAVYIELGNIKNPLDQDRFVLENNRQAVANWLCEGLLKAVK
ncbi:N-acetylmuramoyl-L-alanine amidase [candidate division KSB1 bacterium]|nr:N-acetylmuramoyl-L-alanine amidase [candidate division KSB1 bacterium]